MMIHIPLSRLRTLFLKKTLNQEDADAVVSASETLARAAWTEAHLSATILNISFAIESLGKYFLAFDAISCAVKLLGDRMLQHMWWDDFTLAFDTEYAFNEPETGRQRKPRMLANIANRLLAAINTYKGGMRPPSTEVIALKRLLFCSTYAPRDFKEVMWDPWREDEEHYAVNEYLSG
ncbi:hypothetical protein EBH_0001460 [Eimeria brunetti]|uniref:Uncharacterized protein n=1 Tax=Eimeria brunetti TaxID=51314 RepID=U6LMU8_9EIME|nr:hypothetical protein EBH_0001460 [Eimeria brunetti]